MEIKQIKCFLKVAEHMHFSKAARELNIAQSALSQQILHLENELGCRLFDRSNRWKVSFTEAGKIFFEESREIMEKIAAAQRRTIQASKGEMGSLSIHAIPSFFCSENFFNSIRQMRSQYSGVFLKIGKHSSSNILHQIETGLIDIGIIRVANTDSIGVKSMELEREKVMLALSEKHRLADKNRIFISDLKNEDFIMMPYDESPFFNKIVEYEFRKRGNFIPRVTQEIYNFDAIMRLLENGREVSLVPELMKQQNHYSGVTLKPISDLNIDMKYVAIWNGDNLSIPAHNFLKILKTNFKSVK